MRKKKRNSGSKNGKFWGRKLKNLRAWKWYGIREGNERKRQNEKMETKIKDLERDDGDEKLGVVNDEWWMFKSNEMTGNKICGE